MADYRKWLVAFAVVAILLGFAPTALAVTEAPPLSCAAASAPLSARGEGVAERVGDIILTCSGGSPTTAGQPVPLASIHVQLQVPITSRTLGTAKVGGTSATALTSEAMLLVDEPFPADPFPSGVNPIPGSPLEQVGCIATGGQVTFDDNPYTGTLSGNVGVCEILGDGTGGLTYESYNEQDGVLQYNTFQGVATGNLTTGLATIDFNGVPLDPPGSQNQRIIRITNIRGDMTGLLGPTNSANGVPVVETVSISGSASFTVPASIVTVAYVYQGLQGGAVAGTQGAQCTSFDGSFSITFAEGFVSSFKTRLVTDVDEQAEIGGLQSLRNDEDADWEYQNIPFVNYFTESGFTPTPSNDFPLTGPDNGGDSSNDIGVADTGTRFLITVTNLQNGVSVDFPASVSGAANGSPNLWLWIVPNANSDGTGGTPESTTDVTLDGSWVAGGSSTSAFVVYEVVADDPTQQESVTVSPGVSWTPNLAEGVPALGPNSTDSIAYATVSFAPIAADRPGKPLPTNNGATNTTSRGSLPRFISTAASPSAAITIYPCSCNLLYPWVVGGANTGFDTGLVVANTSISPTIWPQESNPGTAETGTVTLWFTGTQAGAAITNASYPTGTVSDPPIVLPPGCSLELIMSLGSSLNCAASVMPAGEGSINLAVTTGFVGYIIATTTFQYCHGVAYVSPMDNPFEGSYYEAIELDTPFWARGISGVSNANRTGQFGESQGH
jgi:hypothetical protein